MKHIFKFLALLSLAVFMVAPLTVSAAWWNPFSWFKKVQTPKAELVATTTIDSTIQVNTSPTLPPVAPTNPVPVKAQLPTGVVPPPIKNTSNPTTSITKPVASSAPAQPSTTSVVMQVEVPTYVLNAGFTPEGFVSPRNVKNGTTLLTIESVPGKVQAIGTWYVDSITWRMVSDAYQSGDLTVSVAAGQKMYEDSSVINESHTTKLSSHVVSDPISFTINGQTPRKGVVRIVVESIKGHTSSNADVEYVIKGTPLIGPDFNISSN